MWYNRAKGGGDVERKNKYPAGLFWLGFLMYIVSDVLLFSVSVIMLVTGIWYEWALYVGIVLSCINVIYSFIQQIRLRNALNKSGDTDREKWKSAILSRRWLKKVDEVLEANAKERIPFWQS